MIIYNNIIPFKGYKAINIFGIIFARKNANITDVTITHEKIHTKQIIETLFIGFYIIYFIEWLIKLFIYRNNHTAYRNISFEKEAHLFANDSTYLTHRKHYKWIKYIIKNS